MSNEIIIFDYESNINSDIDYLNRGYRKLYIQYKLLYYELNFYEIVRLQQDFETEIKECGFFEVDVNIILVEEVSWYYIEHYIKILSDRCYFDRIKPLNLEVFKSKDLIIIKSWQV